MAEPEVTECTVCKNMDIISRDIKETNSLLTFLSNPKVWIVLVVIVLVGFWVMMLLQNIETRKMEKKVVDSEFRAMCEQDLGELAWMKMVPFRDGVRSSEEACFGCMVDDNNMICDRVEYEQWKAQNK